MKYLLLTVVLFSMCTIANVHAGDRDDKRSVNQVIFERPIGGNGQRLVVVRGPDRNPSLFSFWKNERARDSMGRTAVEQMESVYEVRVELRSTNADPLLLTSRLRVEGGMPQNRGLVVLDALIEPESIVLAMAEGPSLTLWQIWGSSGPCWTPFVTDKPWTPFAAPAQLSERMVAVALSRTKDGRLIVEVADRRVGQHTLYEEGEKGSLRFKAVRQWKASRPKLEGPEEKR